MDCKPIKHGDCDVVRAKLKKKREEEILHMQQAFAANTEELRAFMDLHGLRNADPSGESASVPCLAWYVC
jgi:hypothetical protein